MDTGSCGSSAKRIPVSGIQVGVDVLVVRNSKRCTKKCEGDGMSGGIDLLVTEIFPDNDDPVDLMDADIYTE
jgi:hypothetical protein